MKTIVIKTMEIFRKLSSKLFTKNKPMPKVKPKPLSFERMSDKALMMLARNVIVKMSSTNHFNKELPSLVQIETVLFEYAKAYAVSKHQSHKANHKILNLCRKHLLTHLNYLFLVVKHKAAGHFNREEIIRSAGFEKEMKN